MEIPHLGVNLFPRLGDTITCYTPNTVFLSRPAPDSEPVKPPTNCLKLFERFVRFVLDGTLTCSGNRRGA